MSMVGNIQINKNNIYCCDAIEGLKSLSSNSIDMTLTDIPYDVINDMNDSKPNGFRNFTKGDADILTFNLKTFVKEVSRVTKGSVYIFCSTEQVSEIRKILIEEEFSTRLVIWQKTNPTPIAAEFMWLSSIECCVFGRRSGAVFNEFYKSSVINFPIGKSSIHPTEKPLDMFQYLVAVSSNEKDTILDPCMGSGTTAVAAKSLNRNYIGFDINQEYVNIAEKRLYETKKNDRTIIENTNKLMNKRKSEVDNFSRVKPLF